MSQLATPSPDRRRRTVLWIAKTALGFAGLAWLVSAVRPSRVLDACRSAEPGLLALGVGLLTIAIAAQALRLQVLAGGLGVTWGRSLRITTGSYLFNQLLPGGIGGEGYRALRLIRLADRWPVAIGLIAVERLVGSLSLLVPGTIYYLAERELILRLLAEREPILRLLVDREGDLASLGTDALRWTAAAIVAGTLALAILIFWRFEGLRERLRRTLAEMGAAIASAGVARHAGTVGLSLAYHLLRILGVERLLAALGQRIGLPEVLFVLSITLVVSLLPLTLGALGLKEGAIVFGLSLFGVDEGVGLVVALLNRAVLLVGAAAGAFFLLVEGRRRTGYEAEGQASGYDGDSRRP